MYVKVACDDKFMRCSGAASERKELHEFVKKFGKGYTTSSGWRRTIKLKTDNFVCGLQFESNIG